MQTKDSLKFRPGSIQSRINQLLPEWEFFTVIFHELWREPDGGWSVNNSWHGATHADRESAIEVIAKRWHVFKANYLSRARVRDITDAGFDEESDCLLEVDCTALATVQNAEPALASNLNEL